jgi:sulfatase maturation enzyme AslB (radical SAM superfamily)
MVDIYGGEPTLSTDVDEFLGTLLSERRLDQITLSMSTNCTKIPSGNTLAAIEKAKKIKIALSIDAFGPLNDVIRSGSNWDHVVMAMDFWHDLVRYRPLNSSTVMVHSAVSVYNANKISELDDFVRDYYPLFVRTHQVVQFPLFLSLRNTPADFKMSMPKFINDEKILNYINQPGEDLFGHFINFHKKLNEIRDEDLGNLNPWLSDYINSYKNVPSWFDSQMFFSKAISDLKTNTLV